MILPGNEPGTSWSVDNDITTESSGCRYDRYRGNKVSGADQNRHQIEGGSSKSRGRTPWTKKVIRTFKLGSGTLG